MMIVFANRSLRPFPWRGLMFSALCYVVFLHSPGTRASLLGWSVSVLSRWRSMYHGKTAASASRTAVDGGGDWRRQQALAPRTSRPVGSRSSPRTLGWNPDQYRTIILCNRLAATFPAFVAARFSSDPEADAVTTSQVCWPSSVHTVVSYVVQHSNDLVESDAPTVLKEDEHLIDLVNEAFSLVFRFSGISFGIPSIPNVVGIAGVNILEGRVERLELLLLQHADQIDALRRQLQLGQVVVSFSFINSFIVNLRYYLVRIWFVLYTGVEQL